MRRQVFDQISGDNPKLSPASQEKHLMWPQNGHNVADSKQYFATQRGQDAVHEKRAPQGMSHVSKEEEELRFHGPTAKKLGHPIPIPVLFPSIGLCARLMTISSPTIDKTDSIYSNTAEGKTLSNCFWI